MGENIAIHDFLKNLVEGRSLLLDVRSPKEYKQAHIPGAVSLPLLDDETRKIVGVTYKQRGREAAVLKGFDLVGRKFGDFIREVKKQTESRHVMIYCWRGGMRSNIMSWVLNMGGFKTFVLKGGYKSFRNLVLKTLVESRKIIVIGGKTGSGKTEVLEHLRQSGEQVICLETLANHRGSVYGGLGMPEQPRNEMFENMLAMEWMKGDSNKVLWMENESNIIGAVMLPKKIYEFIRAAPMIELCIDKSERIKRILDEYGDFTNEELISKTENLTKRLGGSRTHNAIEAIHKGNKQEWVEEVLYYYDKAYQYGNENRKTSAVIELRKKGSEAMKDLAKRAIEVAGKISYE